MSRIRVEALHIHPVKSMRGIALDRATVEPMGLAGDRRWMVVDADGRFLTRREHPKLAEVETDITDQELTLRHPAFGAIRIAPPTGPRKAVTVWRDRFEAPVAAGPAADALSDLLGLNVRLAFKPADALRQIDLDYAKTGEDVSFADGFPVLIATTASLADLSRTVGKDLSMGRFRPNIALSGTEPWAEDRWRRIRIGGLDFRIVKPCGRCVITTQDPDTGIVDLGKEPLASLARMGRKAPNGVIFGQNAIPDGVAEIKVGDTVEVLEEGPSNVTGE